MKGRDFRRPQPHNRHVNNMRESSRETQTEDGRRHEPQTQRQNRASHNIVSTISWLVDDHLTLVRSLSGGLALAGVILIARSIKLITKFQAASEIPAHFVENNVSLRGIVHSVKEQSLQVEHVPISLPLLSPLLTKHKGGPSSPLLVNLAGVDLTADGKLWLQRSVLPTQTVWLKLISRQDDTLHCFVTHNKGSSWGRSVNEQALSLGLARTAPVTGLSPDTRLYWRLHKRLHRAEVKAEKKRLGLWKEESQWKRVVKIVRDNALFRLIRRIFRKT